MANIDAAIITKTLNDLKAEFNNLDPQLQKNFPDIKKFIDNSNNLQNTAADYQLIQQNRTKLIQSPAKIIDTTKDDFAARQVIEGDIDYKIVRLNALLKNSAISQNEKFRATMQWLSVNEAERENFKARYELLTGRTLESDLATDFPGEGKMELGIIPQSKFLQNILSQGKITPDAQLALKLGLVESTYTIGRYREKHLGLDRENKGAIRESIEQNPEVFKHLAYSGDPEESDSITALRNFLNHGHSGILGEQQEYLRQHFQLTPEEQNNPRIPKDPAARYLLSLVYDFKKDRPRKIDKEHLRKAMRDFARDPKNAEAIKQLQAAYDDKIQTAGVTGETVFRDYRDPYQQFWHLLPAHSAINGLSLAQIKYIKDVVDAHQQGMESLQPVYDTYALLDRRAAATFKKKTQDTKQQVLQKLSSTNNWQAIAHLNRYAGEDSEDKPVSELTEEAITQLTTKLKAASLGDADVAEIIRQVKLGGAFDADGSNPRSMNAYQELRNLVENKAYPSKDTVLNIIGKVNPGSFDYELIRNDGELLNYIHKEMRPAIGSRDSFQETWNIFAHSFNLGSEWEDYDRDHTDKQTIEPQPYNPLNSYELDAPERANYWAGRLAAQYKIQDDGNRALEVVYQAQAAGVTGADLKQALDRIDPKISDWMVNDQKTFVNPGNQEAHTAIKEYFQSEKLITVKELLSSQKALISYDKQGVNFTVDSLSPEQVLQGWFKDGLTALEQLSEEKVALEMKLLSAALENNQAEITNLQEQLTLKSQEIRNYPLAINSDLDRELDKLVGQNKKEQLKQELIAKAGQALIDGSDEAVGSLKLNSAELQTIGVTLKGQSDIKTQRQLQTSLVGWHYFNTAGVVTSGQVANTLGAFSDVHQAFSEDRDLNHLDAQIEKQIGLIKATIEEEEKLKTSQENWRDVQDRYRENTVKAVTTLLSLMVSTAGLAAGVGAATALTQMIWALSTAAGQSAIKQVVNSALSRKGERFSATTIAEVVADTLESAVTFFAVNELEVGLQLTASSVLDGPEKVVSRGLVEIPIAKLKNILGDLKDGAIDALKQDDFAKHPLDSLASNLGEMLRNQIVNIPQETIQKYLTVTTAEISNLTFNAITAGNYHDSTDITKLYRDEDTGELSEAKKEDALNNVLNYSSKETDKLSYAAQFVGGPTAEMGSDTWMGSEGYGNFGENLGHSLKTALYEEGLRDPAIEALSEKIENVFTATDETAEDSTSEAGVTVQQRGEGDLVAEAMKKRLEAMGVRVPSDRQTPDEIIAYAKENLNIKGIKADEIEKTLKKLQRRLQAEYPIQKENADKMVKQADQLYRERSAKNRPQKNAVRPYMRQQPNHRQDFVRDEVGKNLQGRDRRYEKNEKQARKQELEESRKQQAEKRQRRFHTKKSKAMEDKRRRDSGYSTRTDGGEQEKAWNRQLNR